MSIIVRVLNRDITPAEVDIKIPQNKVGDIVAIIPIGDLLDLGDDERQLRTDLKYSSIEVYQSGRLLRSGIIKDVIPASVGKVDGFYKLIGEDEFGRLAAVWSKPDAHYQDVALTSIIPDLLTIADDWALGDYSTMEDDTVTTTVNTRSKDRLWPQIVEAIETTPKLFVRYGGTDDITGDNLLDMGLFGERDDGRYAIDGLNVIEIKQKRSPVDLIRGIRPKGGKAGETIVTLLGTETTVAGFPILTDVATGEKYVSNSGLTKGALIAKTYSQIRTDNSQPPTNAQISECRQALYDATVRELQLSNEREVLTVVCELPELPLIGQDILIRAKVAVPTLNILTNEYEYITTQNIDGYYRITQIQLKYKDHDGVMNQNNPLTDENDDDWILVQLECTDGLDLSKYDESEYLAKRFTQHEDSEPFGAGIGLGGSYVQVVNQAGVASDCSNGGINGKLFTFPYDPPISANIREVSYEILAVSDTNGTPSVVQAPTLSQPLILCVKGAGGAAWTVLDDTDVTIQYTYYT